MQLHSGRRYSEIENPQGIPPFPKGSAASPTALRICRQGGEIGEVGRPGDEVPEEAEEQDLIS